MYNSLDSPPPRSHFLHASHEYQYTRPWSPDPCDPLQSAIWSSNIAKESRDTFNRSERGHRSRGKDVDDRQPRNDIVGEYRLLRNDQFPTLPSKTRRETSEVSVEALDLADYARTLRVRQAEDPYPAFPFAESSLNSSSRQSQRHLNRTQHLPSSFTAAAANHGGTHSSINTSIKATHQTPRINGTVPVVNDHVRRSHRPFSLPGTATLNPLPDPENEIDISQFPIWSRNWYTSDSQRTSRNSQSNLDFLETYERDAPSSFNHTESAPTGSARQPLSPFDPTYIHPQSHPRPGADTFNDCPSRSAPSYTNHDALLGNKSREGIVPWSYDPPEYGQPPLDPHDKETRMRMLEKAFGTPDPKNSRGTGGRGEIEDGLLRDEHGRLMIGTPDGKGGLATEGPLVRGAVRVLQALLVAAVGAPIIWAGVALKPDPAPPPAGKFPLYILYVFSPITLLLLTYLFVVRPCTVRRRFDSSASAPPGASHGMMVLPITGSGVKHKKGTKGGLFPGQKRGKKGNMMMIAPGDVQVNLIVDPNAFGLPGRDISSSDEDDDMMLDDGGMPGAFFSYQDAGKDNSDRQRMKRKRQRRRTLMASLRLEEEWKLARGWMRKLAFVDSLVFILWGVAFGFVISGKRCPTGGQAEGYGGWCTAYNASTAATCLLCVSFAVSIFFGVKDLYASKLSPRMRM